MAFAKKTVKDIDIKNKTMLVRVDYNVPIGGDSSVGDLYRVKSSVPTIKYLLDNDCKIILISHLGRPEGQQVKKYSLEPVAKELSNLVDQKVEFVDDCVGTIVQKAAAKLRPKEILLLENLRFHPEEEKNDKGFAQELASLGEVFVQDGFGVVHRAHASTDAITKFLPSVAGLLLAKEVDTITDAMESPKRPLVTIVGGAKVSDKVVFIEKLIERSQYIVIGGAMANTFLAAMGLDVGKSVYEKAAVPEALRLIKLVQAKNPTTGVDLYLPTDGLVASSPEDKAKPMCVSWGPPTMLGVELHEHDHQHEHAEHEHAHEHPANHVHEVEGTQMILDIGPDSVEQTLEIVDQAKTVIWNGPVGMSEYPNFAQGSLAVAHGIINSKAKSIVGGGDTAAFVEEQGLSDKFDWVSTGGGASLELMSGKKLPGVEALLDK